MKVKNRIFLHLASKGALHAGQKLVTGPDGNALWRRIREADLLCKSTIGGRKITLDSMIRHAISVYQGNERKLDSSYHYNPLDTLAEASTALIQSLVTIRELVFERVRLENYSAAPSRLRCIWLIPDMEGCLHAWTKAHEIRGFDIWRVRATGILQYANARHAEAGTVSLNSWEGLAHRYWSGDRVGEPSTEALLEGELEFLEVIGNESVKYDGGSH